MAKETISSIREAELKASQILKDAESLKAEILEKARAEVREYEETVITQARNQARADLARTQGQLDDRIGDASRQAEAVVAQHQEGMGAKRAEAVRIVISTIA